MDWKYTDKIGKMSDEELKKRIKEVMSLDTYKKIRPIPYVGSDEKVVYETSEFVARCPETGIIDFYKLRIEYIPDKKLPELKSFKYYLMQFEEIPISHEHLASKVYDDFQKVVQPKRLYVYLEVNIRGGIKTYIERGEKM